jgi:hypothetical protein
MLTTNIFIFIDNLNRIEREREREKKNFGLREEANVNEVSVRSSSNPMPTGQRNGGEDLLLPFESRHYNHQSLVTRTKTKMVSF